MWFGIGLLIGIVVAIVILVIFKVSKQDCRKYDERQIAARGKAYRAGFVAITLCELVVFFIELFTEEPLVLFMPGVLQIYILLFGLLVFIEYSIFSDAYFIVGERFNIKWCIIMFLLGAVYILQAIRSDKDGFMFYTFGAGIFIEITIISILIKHGIDKKREASIEADDDNE